MPLCRKQNKITFTEQCTPILQMLIFVKNHKKQKKIAGFVFVLPPISSKPQLQKIQASHFMNSYSRKSDQNALR